MRKKFRSLGYGLTAVAIVAFIMCISLVGKPEWSTFMGLGYILLILALLSHTISFLTDDDPPRPPPDDGYTNGRFDNRGGR